MSFVWEAWLTDLGPNRFAALALLRDRVSAVNALEALRLIEAGPVCVGGGSLGQACSVKEMFAEVGAVVEVRVAT